MINSRTDWRRLAYLIAWEAMKDRQKDEEEVDEEEKGDREVDE